MNRLFYSAAGVPLASLPDGGGAKKLGGPIGSPLIWKEIF